MRIEKFLSGFGKDTGPVIPIVITMTIETPRDPRRFVKSLTPPQK